MNLPDKSSFKFGELPVLTGVKPYVLRFWETEFEDIRPISIEDGTKIYSRLDVETIIRIKELLFDHKLSLHAAKVAIKTHPQVVTAAETLGFSREDNDAVLLTLGEALAHIQTIKHKYHW